MHLLQAQALTRLRDYTAADCALYALAVGVGADEADAADRALAREESLAPLPTFAAAIGWDNEWIHATGVDTRLVLHAHQRIRMEKPMPARGRLRIVSRISAIHDRGPGRAAVLVHETRLYDAADESLLCTSWLTAHARNAGGFGGPAQPREETVPSIEPDAATAERTAKTRPEQALLYRLTGDRNALHVDPLTAQAAGFERPILHGLCTFGFACRAVVLQACGGDPSHVREIEARFCAPVLPGQALRTEICDRDDDLLLQTRCVETGRLVLDRGRVRLFPRAPQAS